MSAFISSIASGSNGNCYYIGTADEAVLIDAGISCREIERRMQRCGLSMHRVKAIFISHEHSDHIQGAAALARKYDLPVYITDITLRFGRLQFKSHPVRPFYNGQPVTVGSLNITPFLKAHDAADPHSFIITCNEVTIGVFTDIGRPCAYLSQHFSKCHAAFLEANYDEKMLMQGSYPAHLKARISGGRGHLSNRQALELFKKFRPAHMSHLLLAHLSKNNNCPKLVDELFKSHAGPTQIVVASRYEETDVYHIKATKTFQSMTAAPVPHYQAPVAQLEFSF